MGDAIARGPCDTFPRVPLGNVPVNELHVGERFACVLVENGSVKCWGKGGAVGAGDSITRGMVPNQMGDALQPINLGTGRIALRLAAGAERACAILDTFEMVCWVGGSGEEVIGDDPQEMGDNLAKLAVGFDGDPEKLAVGQSVACLLTSGNKIYCWENQISDRTVEWADFAGQTIASISAGPAHVCALTVDGKVKCWGSNVNGRLGYGDDMERKLDRNLPNVHLGGIGFATGIFLCQESSCAILSDKTIKCWGTGGKFPRKIMGDTLDTIHLPSGKRPIDGRCSRDWMYISFDDGTVGRIGGGIDCLSNVSSLEVTGNTTRLSNGCEVVRPSPCACPQGYVPIVEVSACFPFVPIVLPSCCVKGTTAVQIKLLRDKGLETLEVPGRVLQYLPNEDSVKPVPDRRLRSAGISDGSFFAVGSTEAGITVELSKNVLRSKWDLNYAATVVETVVVSDPETKTAVSAEVWDAAFARPFSACGEEANESEVICVGISQTKSDGDCFRCAQRARNSMQWTSRGMAMRQIASGYFLCCSCSASNSLMAVISCGPLPCLLCIETLKKAGRGEWLLRTSTWFLLALILASVAFIDYAHKLDLLDVLSESPGGKIWNKGLVHPAPRGFYQCLRAVCNLAVKRCAVNYIAWHTGLTTETVSRNVIGARELGRNVPPMARTAITLALQLLSTAFANFRIRTSFLGQIWIGFQTCHPIVKAVLQFDTETAHLERAAWLVLKLFNDLLCVELCLAAVVLPEIREVSSWWSQCSNVRKTLVIILATMLIIIFFDTVVRWCLHIILVFFETRLEFHRRIMCLFTSTSICVLLLVLTILSFDKSEDWMWLVAAVFGIATKLIILPLLASFLLPVLIVFLVRWRQTDLHKSCQALGFATPCMEVSPQIRACAEQFVTALTLLNVFKILTRVVDEEQVSEMTTIDVARFFVNNCRRYRLGSFASNSKRLSCIKSRRQSISMRLSHIKSASPDKNTCASDDHREDEAAMKYPKSKLVTHRLDGLFVELVAGVCADTLGQSYENEAKISILSNLRAFEENVQLQPPVHYWIDCFCSETPCEMNGFHGPRQRDEWEPLRDEWPSETNNIWDPHSQWDGSVALPKDVPARIPSVVRSCSKHGRYDENLADVIFEQHIFPAVALWLITLEPYVEHLGVMGSGVPLFCSYRCKFEAEICRGLLLAQQLVFDRQIVSRNVLDTSLVASEITNEVTTHCFDLQKRSTFRSGSEIANQTTNEVTTRYFDIQKRSSFRSGSEIGHQTMPKLAMNVEGDGATLDWFLGMSVESDSDVPA